MAKAPAKKPRQKSLPKMGPVKNTKIESLAERFVDARDEWQGRLKPMIDAQDLLHIAMKEAKLAIYEMPDGSKVEIVGSEKVRVRRPKPESNGEA